MKERLKPPVTGKDGPIFKGPRRKLTKEQRLANDLAASLEAIETAKTRIIASHQSLERLMQPNSILEVFNFITENDEKTLAELENLLAELKRQQASLKLPSLEANKPPKPLERLF